MTSQARRKLFGFAPPLPRAPKPYDHMSKAQMWAELERLRAQLARADRIATLARNSIGTEGTEGTPAYRTLAAAREHLREVCSALTEVRK